MQTPDHNQPSQDEALEAPPQLVSALKRLPQPPVFIPPTANDTILRAARRHLNPPRPAAPGWFRFLPWVAAAAAAVVLLLAIPQLLKQAPTSPAREAAFAPADLNHDGRLDILDAFALARQLKQDGTRNLQLDLNGDGVVDERDVSTLAARAVKLERGGRS